MEHPQDKKMKNIDERRDGGETKTKRKLAHPKPKWNEIFVKHSKSLIIYQKRIRKLLKDG
jgi:hypothetical protein